MTVFLRLSVTAILRLSARGVYHTLERVRTPA